MRPTWNCFVLLWIGLLAGCAASFATPVGPAPLPPTHVEYHDLEAALPVGRVKFDLYLPAASEPVPLVVVAHGFLRSKAQMADWGRRLAVEGFAAAVPTLPNLIDHAGNGRAIDDLIAWLLAAPQYAPRLDGTRLGCIGHSAGGLATLLAAADNPRIAIWVGLDPVDLRGMGMAAVPRLRAKAVILRAEPSIWNQLGNARDLVKALGPRCEDHLVTNANHIDAEWPTDAAAQLAIGRTNEAYRQEFVTRTIAALKEALAQNVKQPLGANANNF